MVASLVVEIANAVTTVRQYREVLKDVVPILHRQIVLPITRGSEQ